MTIDRDGSRGDTVHKDEDRQISLLTKAASAFRQTKQPFAARVKLHIKKDIQKCDKSNRKMRNRFQQFILFENKKQENLFLQLIIDAGED